MIRLPPLITVVLLSISPALCLPKTVISEFQGQVSLNYFQSLDQTHAAGPLTLRYLPRLRVDKQLPSQHRLGLDLAFDLYNYQSNGFSTGDGEFYRCTLRYDSPATQFRLGLQKINFGPAKMLRVLQWFDQVDPRDPLALSPGVWAAMGRQYFDNGINLRLWAITDASDGRRDFYTRSADTPLDVGGRLEYPLNVGTLGLTLHSMGLGDDYFQEQRAALDLRLDAIIGIWSELMTSRVEQLTAQDQFTAMIGMDYTFSIGNGLYVALEALTSHSGNFEKEMSQLSWSTALTANYSIGLADAISVFLYAVELPAMEVQYIPMIGWQHTRGNWLFYLALFDSPAFTSGGALNLPGGTGLQLNIAHDH